MGNPHARKIACHEIAPSSHPDRPALRRLRRTGAETRSGALPLRQHGAPTGHAASIGRHGSTRKHRRNIVRRPYRHGGNRHTGSMAGHVSCLGSQQPKPHDGDPLRRRDRDDPQHSGGRGLAGRRTVEHGLQSPRHGVRRPSRTDSRRRLLRRPLLLPGQYRQRRQTAQHLRPPLVGSLRTPHLRLERRGLPFRPGAAPQTERSGRHRQLFARRLDGRSMDQSRSVRIRSGAESRHRPRSTTGSEAITKIRRCFTKRCLPVSVA